VTAPYPHFSEDGITSIDKKNNQNHEQGKVGDD
jgi:hypothetical protein